MRIERMPSLRSPSLVEVLESKPLGNKSTSYQVVAYRGNEPTTKLNDLPSGRCVMLGEGFVFLSSGESHVVSSRNDAMIDSIGGLIAPFAGAAIPLGGILSTLGFAGARAALDAASNPMSKLQQQLLNPDTFIVPYVNIVECDFVRVGSILTRRNFVVISTETEHSEQSTYCLCVTGNHELLGKTLRNDIWLGRIVSDLRVAQGLVRQELGVSQIRDEVTKRYLEQCEKTGTTPSGEELQMELNRAVNEFRLPAREFQSMVAKKLGHLKPLAYEEPQAEELKFLRTWFAK